MHSCSNAPTAGAIKSPKSFDLGLFCFLTQAYQTSFKRFSSDEVSQRPPPIFCTSL